jgi:hypothetical protein
VLEIGVDYAVNHPPSGMFPCIALDDDGYYWFLHPLFERLAAETGEYIDLYGNATFFGGDLCALEQMLTKARGMVLSLPEAWDVHTGTQLLPVHQEVFKPVERARLLYLLDTWEDAVRVAKEHERPIVCFGD